MNGKIYVNLMFAAMILLCLVPTVYAVDGITITRTTDGAAIPGETIEVRLNVDVSEDNKPSTYILTEMIPEGFEVVDSDAKVTDDVQMKWVAIDGLLGGKVEDTTYVYHLKAPDSAGEYGFNGSVMLSDKTKADVSGALKITVGDGAINTPPEDNNAGIRFAPYVIIAIVILTMLVFYPKKKKKIVKKTKADEEDNENEKKDVLK